MKRFFIRTLLLFISIAGLFTALILRQPTAIESNHTASVLITNFHPGHSGGHLTYIKNLLTGSIANQYDFALAAPQTSDIYQRVEGNATVYDCNFPVSLRELPETIEAMVHFYKVCKIVRPDIIHCNGGHDTTIAAWVSLFLPKKPHVVRTFHAAKKIGKDPYHWVLYGQIVDQSIFVSMPQYQNNLDKGGLPLANAVVIENGVDTEYYRPKAFDENLASSLGVNNDFIFGSCAGLSAYKRVDLMLEAIADLKDDYDFKVLVVGREDHALGLVEKAKQLGIQNRFIYGGYTTDVRPFNSLFTVGFILSDSTETISFAAREMLSMGIPLVSSSYMGLKSNIEDMKNGILVAPGSLEELKNAMITFLTMPEDERMQYREYAREKAIRDFSIEKQFKETCDVYEAVLNWKNMG